MIDWKLLKLPIIVMLISLLISISAWSWADSYNTVKIDDNTVLERDYTNARSRYNNAQRDRDLYKKYLDSFLQYKNQGIIGEEQRLSWIEELEAINKKLKLSSLRYEISPQTQANLSGLRLPPGIKLNASNMKLTAGLLHEGDVLTILNALKENANGFFSIKQCDLVSLIGENTELRYKPGTSYVRMNCELEWYTIEVAS